VISYAYFDNVKLKIAKCNDPACVGVNENIIALTQSGESNSSFSPSIAIGKDGYPVIAYNNVYSDLKVAKMQPSAEIQPGWGISGASGDNLTSAAAGGGCTFQTGEWSEGSKTSPTLDLTANHCTELAFMLDTSEAVVGTIYRLRLVTSGGAELSTYSQYPAFTVVSDTGRRYSKEDVMMTASSCTGITEGENYNCAPIDSTNDVGQYTSIAIGTDGNPVISYYDNTDKTLKVYHCTDTSCSSGDDYTVDSPGGAGAGQYSSIAIGTDGNPVISYYDYANYALKVYHCTNPSCSSGDANTVDDPAVSTVGYYTSIAIGTDGYPVIAYQDTTDFNLKVAKCNDQACYGQNETITHQLTQALSATIPPLP
jgi:hypothetical protein